MSNTMITVDKSIVVTMKFRIDLYTNCDNYINFLKYKSTLIDLTCIETNHFIL